MGVWTLYTTGGLKACLGLGSSSSSDLLDDGVGGLKGGVGGLEAGVGGLEARGRWG